MNENEQLQRNNAVNFLLYSYFKVYLKSSCQEVFNSAIAKAYSDAVGQGAFNTIVSKESKELLSEVRQKAFLKMDIILKSHLHSGVFENDWHEKWCREIVDIFSSIKTSKGDKAFTYGNAQKWINMTLKNMYIMAYFFKCENSEVKSDWCDIVLDNASCYHIPLDSYILKAAYEFDSMQNRIKVRGKKNLEYRIIADEKEYCWSTIPNYEIYSEFQNSFADAVKEKYKLNPLDWECGAWISTAKEIHNQ